MRPTLFLYLLAILCSCGAPAGKKNNLPKASGTCVYARDEKDPLGKRIRVVEDQVFISLAATDSSLRNPGYSFKAYLSCVSVDTVLGVYFNFKIYSADADQTHGMIQKDNRIRFILKSGQSVSLPFGRTFSGNTNLSKEETEFSSFARLSAVQAELLVSGELQEVMISWSKKDEKYAVINPTIFVNQLPCVRERQ